MIRLLGILVKRRDIRVLRIKKVASMCDIGGVSSIDNLLKYRVWRLIRVWQNWLIRRCW